jgi:hypothetical protein
MKSDHAVRPRISRANLDIDRQPLGRAAAIGRHLPQLTDPSAPSGIRGVVRPATRLASG